VMRMTGVAGCEEARPVIDTTRPAPPQGPCADQA